MGRLVGLVGLALVLTPWTTVSSAPVYQGWGSLHTQVVWTSPTHAEQDPPGFSGFFQNTYQCFGQAITGTSVSDLAIDLDATTARLQFRIPSFGFARHECGRDTIGGGDLTFTLVGRWEEQGNQVTVTGAFTTTGTGAYLTAANAGVASISVSRNNDPNNGFGDFLNGVLGGAGAHPVSSAPPAFLGWLDMGTELEWIGPTTAVNRIFAGGFGSNLYCFGVSQTGGPIQTLLLEVNYPVVTGSLDHFAPFFGEPGCNELTQGGGNLLLSFAGRLEPDVMGNLMLSGTVFGTGSGVYDRTVVLGTLGGSLNGPLAENGLPQFFQAAMVAGATR